MKNKKVQVIDAGESYTGCKIAAKKLGCINYHAWFDFKRAENGDVLTIVKHVPKKDCMGLIDVSDDGIYVVKDENNIEYIINADGVIIIEDEFKVGDWVVFEYDRTPQHLRTSTWNKSHVLKIDRIDPISLLFFAWQHPYNNDSSFSNRTSLFRKATVEEIKNHLIAEAKRRGFDKDGVIYDCVRSTKKKCIYNTGHDKHFWQYDPEHDSLSRFCNRYFYCNGKWATIHKMPIEYIDGIGEVQVNEENSYLILDNGNRILLSDLKKIINKYC